MTVSESQTSLRIKFLVSFLSLTVFQCCPASTACAWAVGSVGCGTVTVQPQGSVLNFYAALSLCTNCCCTVVTDCESVNGVSDSRVVIVISQSRSSSEMLNILAILKA